MNFIDIDPVIFQCPEEPFRPSIVQTLTLAVHANPDAVLLEQRAVVRVSEMATLITVDDFRFETSQGSLQAVQDKGFIESARQFIINNVPAEPVDDDEQVHKAFGHRNISDIDAPDLVGLGDWQVPQQIGFEELGMISFAEIRLGKQRVNAHFRHDSPGSLLVDQDAIVAAQDLGDCPVTPGRLVCVDPVDDATNLEFFVVDELQDRLAIHRGPGDVEQFTLALDGDLGIANFDQFSCFACDVRLAIPDPFFLTSQPRRSTGQPCVQDPRRACVPLPIPSRLRTVPS